MKQVFKPYKALKFIPNSMNGRGFYRSIDLQNSNSYISETAQIWPNCGQISVS
jgi:hypothetical protein